MDKTVYVVRGTGYILDGHIVNISKTMDVDGVDYCTVHPLSVVGYAQKSLLIERRYLVKLKDSLKTTYSYTVSVTKTNNTTKVEKVASKNVLTSPKSFNINDIVNHIANELENLH